MKRHLIQLAKKTLVVSLPTKWINEHSLKKGDEVELCQNESSITITTEKLLKEGCSASVDVSGSAVIVKRLLAGLYKAGYDEINITFGNTEELEEIYAVVRDSLLGFEITSQGKNTATIKQVSKIEEEEFENLVRRIFLIEKTMGEDILCAAEERNTDWLRQIVLRDKDINKLTDFCRRLLVRKNSFRSQPAYTMLEMLEKIGDRYKYLASKIADSKTKLSQGTLSQLASANGFFSSFYTMFYKPDVKTLRDFKQASLKARKAIEKEMQTATKKELEILFDIREIISLTYDMNGPLICAKM